ncbi:Anthrax Toxin Receptor 2 [Manis pentadactyla]|nr:Anthrax Toxin Receptor 2 [Manis pentadactyla]
MLAQATGSREEASEAQTRLNWIQDPNYHQKIKERLVSPSLRSILPKTEVKKGRCYLTEDAVTRKPLIPRDLAARGLTGVFLFSIPSWKKASVLAYGEPAWEVAGLSRKKKRENSWEIDLDT